VHLGHSTPAQTSGWSAIPSAAGIRWRVLRNQIPEQPPAHQSACERNVGYTARLGTGAANASVEAIEVCDWLIDHTEDLRIDLAGRRIPCRSGRQLGSRYRDSQTAGLTLDYLPDPLLEKSAQYRRLCPSSRARQVDLQQRWPAGNLLARKATKRAIHRTFIDQGYCFNAGEWSFPDYPLRGVYANNWRLPGCSGWDAFEPALSRQSGWMRIRFGSLRPIFRRSGTNGTRMA